MFGIAADVEHRKKQNNTVPSIVMHMIFTRMPTSTNGKFLVCGTVVWDSRRTPQ